MIPAQAEGAGRVYIILRAGSQICQELRLELGVRQKKA